MSGSCKHNNEPSGSMKREFLDQLSDIQLLKEDSAEWNELVSAFKFCACSLNQNVILVNFSVCFHDQCHMVMLVYILSCIKMKLIPSNLNNTNKQITVM
jgi:hypothetical protein